MVLFLLSLIGVSAWYLVTNLKAKEIYEIEMNSMQENTWTFPLLYLALIFIGQYFPIGAQIVCIWISIKGNWNELYQSELVTPDEDVSVNSHMLQSFKHDLDKESILRSQLSGHQNLDTMSAHQAVLQSRFELKRQVSKSFSGKIDLLQEDQAETDAPPNGSFLISPQASPGIRSLNNDPSSQF
mmetsp:Transcript_16061/g.24932  ORF Transcript_16061/g.24932 Transcript_16061/m.24932 type:complete len:184 (+) Transcript_16061:1073-1624(+)